MSCCQNPQINAIMHQHKQLQVITTTLPLQCLHQDCIPSQDGFHSLPGWYSINQGQNNHRRCCPSYHPSPSWQCHRFSVAGTWGAAPVTCARSEGPHPSLLCDSLPSTGPDKVVITVSPHRSPQWSHHESKSPPHINHQNPGQSKGGRTQQ